jgi:hypothetical protein
MNGKTGASRRRQAGHRLVAVAAVAATALMVAACGGGSRPAGTSASPSQGRVQQLDVFARCMRSHGVANFYFSNSRSNPGSGSGPVLTVMGYTVSGVNPQQPPFPAAIKDCKHLLPGGGSPHTSQQQIKSMLKFARCMRAHGFPGYPDPDVQNGGVIQQPLPSSIDTTSPQFESAQKACGS